MWGYPRSWTSSDLMELNDSVETQLWVIPRQIDRELVLLTPYPLRIFRNFGSGVVLGVDFDFHKHRLVKLTVT